MQVQSSPSEQPRLRDLLDIRNPNPIKRQQRIKIPIVIKRVIIRLQYKEDKVRWQQQIQFIKNSI